MEKHSDFADVIPLIKNVLDNCFNYAFASLPDNSVIDLGVFLFVFKKINIDLEDEEFRTLGLKIDNCISNIKPDIKALIGKSLLPAHSNYGKFPGLASGFAILFPE